MFSKNKRKKQKIPNLYKFYKKMKYMLKNFQKLNVKIKCLICT